MQTAFGESFTISFPDEPLNKTPFSSLREKREKITA